jgi:hypothetical protein
MARSTCSILPLSSHPYDRVHLANHALGEAEVQQDQVQQETQKDQIQQEPGEEGNPINVDVTKAGDKPKAAAQKTTRLAQFHAQIQSPSTTETPEDSSADADQGENNDKDDNGTATANGPGDSDGGDSDSESGLVAEDSNIKYLCTN